MLIKKSWQRYEDKDGGRRLRHVYTGWFLLGFIPLYVTRVTFM
jgi:hypothetical protein